MRVRAFLAAGWLMVERGIIRVLQRLLFPPLDAGRAENIRYIVVYRIGNIGDIALSVPALQTIRRHFPGAAITLLTSAGNAELPGAADVLEPLPPLVDRIVHYRPADLKSPAGLGDLKAQLLETAGSVDLFIDLPVSMQTFTRNLRELFFARQIGARYAIGFSQIFPPVFRHHYSRAFPDRIPKTADGLLVPLVHAGMKPVKTLPVALNDTWREKGEVLAEKLGLFADRPLMLVNAGAKLAIKRWPARSFARTIDRLTAEIPALQVLLLGNADERVLNRTILEAVANPEPVKNLAGELSLPETMTLFRRAQAVLSNDTGAMHLAGLFGVPATVPLGGQFPRPLWEPPGDSHRVVDRPMPCAPCFRDACPYVDTSCLSGIDVRRVVEPLAASFGNAGQPDP